MSGTSGTTGRGRLPGAGAATAAALALAGTGSLDQASVRSKPLPKAEQVKPPAGRE
ncbi:hypothetical protein ABZZ04_13695 [Streptomyces sp. NPDC006435]|uniref:hypothetical protein n=1 Tax=Streptomyces sp. NPDC006435 TaxID=3154300 RepID=UPI0033A9D69A